MSTQSASRYFVPQPSYWPLVGSTALLIMAFGAVLLFNSVPHGGLVLLAGLAVLTVMLFGWFGRVIDESEGGSYNLQVDQSFRWSMGWFIFSEVMFFAAFFGALFYVRVLSVPELVSPSQSCHWYPAAEHNIVVEFGRHAHLGALGNAGK